MPYGYMALGLCLKGRLHINIYRVLAYMYHNDDSGEVLQRYSNGDDRKIFLGLKFSILGIFWVGKLGKHFFVCGLI